MKNFIEKLKVCYNVLTSDYYAFFSVRNLEKNVDTKSRRSRCYISNKSEKSKLFMECVEIYARTVLIKNLDIDSLVKSKLINLPNKDKLLNVHKVILESVESDVVSVKIIFEKSNFSVDKISNSVIAIESILTENLKRKVKVSVEIIK